MTTESPINQGAGEGPAANAGDGVLRVRTALSDEEIRARLGEACRRGRLPGYENPGAAGRGVLFTVTDFGTPFESRLTARRAGRAEGERDAGEIVFEVRLKPALPAVFGVLMVLTVWPGVWFTESLLATYLPGTLVTEWVWWWYLLLTVPFLPWAAWAAVKRSRETGREGAARVVEGIRGALESSRAAEQQSSK